MLKKLGELKSWQKTNIAFFYDATVTFLAFTLALVLRLGDIEKYPQITSNFFVLSLITSASQLIVFYISGLYKGIWRYSSTIDLIKVIKASTAGILVSFVAIFLYSRLELIPRSLFFIQWGLLVIGLGGGRFTYRILRDLQLYNSIDPKTRKRILILGAGSGGENLCREIKKNNSLGLYIVGFVDDSESLQNRALHGIPVLGKSKNLPSIIKSERIEAVYLAIPSASSEQIREIYKILRESEVEIKTLPPISRMLKNQSTLSNLQSLKIEDLLGREEILIDSTLLRKAIENKKVLVTGAGGSIGSELCLQIAKFNPLKLVAIDVSEFNIYALEKNLNLNFPELSVSFEAGDVRDYDCMENIFTREKPDFVLHAAAYKHVPIMEFNPYQSVKTNIFGTKNIASLCIEHAVKRFVLVSTDKAVNPTNVMGCTKRIAEMLIQDLQGQSRITKFMTVRFGNVLGSSGSVIPLFRKQIESGGPVTVTHPEITRFFMSIPEASKLVLQAASMGIGGELFVLDMGKPVKIISLAKEMIELAGLSKEIKIEISGLRPGEKLYEEPLCDSELSLPTNHEKVKINKARKISSAFSNQLNTLLALTPSQSRELFINSMKAMVPEYEPFGVIQNKENSNQDENQLRH